MEYILSINKQETEDGLSLIHKTQINNSTKIKAILNIKVDKIRENCKGTGTLQKTFHLQKGKSTIQH